MNITKVCLLSCALINALLFTGCATVTRGTTETVMIQSVPTGADVRISNGFTGRTPFTFTVPRKGDLIVTLSHPGYVSQEHVLHSGVAGKGAAGVAGNVLIGGVIGIGVDMATGASLSHKPNPLVVTLQRIEPPTDGGGKLPPAATDPLLSKPDSSPPVPPAATSAPVAAQSELPSSSSGAADGVATAESPAT